jgi:hypothetical protein
VALALAASKRVHSLFMLRLFNDGVTMALAYGAVALFMSRRVRSGQPASRQAGRRSRSVGAALRRRTWWQHECDALHPTNPLRSLPLALLQWYAGSALYSLALGVKMNVLLFAPGLALLLVRNVGPVHAAGCAAVVVAVQAALGAPFLATYPASYLGRAFELGRVFFHTWTVNWKFVPEAVFVGKPMAAGLLVGHLATLLALAHWRWTAADGGLVAVCTRAGLLPQAVGRALLGPLRWGALLAGVAADVAVARAGAGVADDAAAPPLRLAKPVGEDGVAASDDVEGRSTPLAGSGSSDGDSSPPAAATPTRVSLRRRTAAAKAAAAAAPSSSSSSSGATPRATVDTSDVSLAAPAGGGAASPVRHVPSAAAAAGMLPVRFADSPSYIAYVLLASNFVGIAFARTLHYQFYSWYFHALPALALGWGASSGLPLALRLAALGAVEWAFNVGDAAGAGSPASSAALQVGHAVVLACLVLGRVPATGAAAAVAAPAAPAARKAPA